MVGVFVYKKMPKNAQKRRIFLVAKLVTSNALRSLTIAPNSPHHNTKSLQKFTKVYKKRHS